MHIGRTLLRASIVLVVLVVGAAAAAVVISQTAWFRNWLRGYIVAEAHQYLNGDLSISALNGNLFSSVEIVGLSISAEGRPVAAVDRISLEYSLLHIATSGVAIDQVRLTRPVVYIRRDERGWELSRLLKKQEQEADREGPQSPLDVNGIVIEDGSLVLEDSAAPSEIDIPDRLDDLDASMSFAYAPVRYSLDIEALAFRGSKPSLTLNEFSGGLAVENDNLYLDHLALRLDQTNLALNGAVQHYLTTPTLAIDASSDTVSVPEIARLVPALRGVELQPAFELAIEGPLDELGMNLNVRSSAGGAVAKVVADLQSPGQSVNGTLSASHLNLAPLLNDPSQASDITAALAIDLEAASFDNLDSLRGTASIEAPALTAAGYKLDLIRADARVSNRQVALSGQAAAYGANLTTSGTLDWRRDDAPIGFDLSGQIAHVNLRRMPGTLSAPRVQTDVNARYHVVGSQALGTGRDGTTVSADMTLSPSTIPGAGLVAGSTAGITMRGQMLAYRADLSVTGLDLQEVGVAFDMPALADARFDSAIDGRLTAQGSGTSLGSLQLDANGAIENSTLGGGSIPALSFTARVADDSAHVTAKGRLADVDPGVLSGREELKGNLGGQLAVDASIDGVAQGVTADNVSATVQVTLDPSEVGGLSVERGELAARYEDRAADVQSLEIAGPDLNASASGTLALNETGQSNLTFHLDSPTLETLGEIVGQAVSGIAAVDGTVTGNRTELQAAGALKGDGLRYQENGALSLNADYTVRVPEMDFARGVVEADTEATFVTLAGQEINELTANVSYEDRQLGFELTAEQPERSLDAAGLLILHPDHQEIHLERLNVAAAGQRWQVAPGHEPAIQYAANAIAIENLALVSGDQQITADGRFGQPDDQLTVSLGNIDLAGVEALLLRPPQFTGRLNGEAVLGGSRDQPQVRGSFEVTGGAFRQFNYETLGGTVDYGSAGIDVDARLQQSADQWIDAKGHLPMALFAGSGASASSGTPAPVEPVTDADRIDFTVDSSPLGLGLVQGFTPMLTDVQGTLEAHIRVAGSAADPQATGAIEVADGVFAVAPTGVTYTNFAGRIDLEPDRVRIDQITVLDNHQSALSITGQLAVRGRQVQAGQLWVTAQDFKVVDNEIGEVRIQSAIELAGTFQAPQIRGDLGVSTGRINLDELLALAGPSVYATEAAESDTSALEADAAQPSLFDALRMNLRLTVPNDLVVRASNLQTPGSSVSLGALNVTLGGDLTALKEPGEALELVGAVNTVRGTYDFQGRRFDILRDGQIRFEEDLRNPRLDLRTARVISGVEARVNVRGYLRSPEIVLSSEPPLEQADILSLIVFNQPINQLGEGEQISLAQRAQSLAAGALTGQISQSIGNALNLDTFEIQLAPVNGGGPEVTFGQQVGQNLYLKVRQGVGSDNTTNLVVEYALTEWLRLQTNIAQGTSSQQSVFRRRQGSGADLIVLFTR
jgi:autotransporter translocation and assembly factor TamB